MTLTVLLVILIVLILFGFPLGGSTGILIFILAIFLVLSLLGKI